MKLWRVNTTEFDHADYSDGSTTTTTAGGQHQTADVVSAEPGNQRSACNRREYVLSDHCRYTQTGAPVKQRRLRISSELK